MSFPLVSDPETEILAWTTTPWTLPSNLALCVNPEFEYIKIRDENGRKFILLESRLVQIYKDPKKAKFEVLERNIKGKDMVGWKYVPIFDYFISEYHDRAFKVIADDYVTADDGTGIVQNAPAFGEDDYRVCLAAGVFDKESHPPCPLNDAGVFTKEVPDFEGQYVKSADKEIQRHIKAKGRLIVQSTFVHKYPFCWRSDTPLIYRTVPCWFVRVAGFNDKLVECNKQTRWVPKFVGESRFMNWIANARDWNISRNRYWGTPIPIWASEDFEEIVCIGSVEELRQYSGCGEINDLHRESIDHITIPSKKGKGNLKRIEEVFDCWFESGSMPYASKHYPFENKEEFESAFPAQFIAEGLDQTRGWFYTLLVLGVHLFDKAPFQNVIVNGIVLASDGKKMSKRLKNYPEPGIILDEFGADALRLYLISSPVVRGETLKFRKEGVKEVITQALLPWWNSFRFFENQALLFESTNDRLFKYTPSKTKKQNVMDNWIIASCQSLLLHIKTEMEAYRLYNVLPRLLALIENLTNWYIRFNRRRLKGENGPEDTMDALNTLFEALFTLTRAMSSFTPFLSENIYLRLKKFISDEDLPSDSRSVHFLLLPDPRTDLLDENIERRVRRMQKVIELGRIVRERKTISLKVSNTFFR